MAAAGSTGAAVASGCGGGGAGFGSGFGGAAGSGVRIREIGGKNDRVFPVSPSARLGRGFFSSINDTVSMGGFGGLGVSTAFGDSAGAFVTGAGVFRAGSVCERGFVGGAAAGAVALARASTFVLLAASLCFASGADRDEPAALAGLRAGAGLRAAVFVVVFVGI
jgi:hypothetical protein